MPFACPLPHLPAAKSIITFASVEVYHIEYGIAIRLSASTRRPLVEETAWTQFFSAAYHAIGTTIMIFTHDVYRRAGGTPGRLSIFRMAVLPKRI